MQGYCLCIYQQHLNNSVLTDIKTLYIDDLCVDETLRGKHIGKELYDSAVELAKELGEILEFNCISVLTPEEHDEMIGFLSQLTHCIAVALMTCKDSRYLVDYTGDSFRDLTRIAKINENMWSELFLMNKNQLLSQMDLFLKQFKELRDALAKEDEEKMKEIMRLSTERRKYFDK